LWEEKHTKAFLDLKAMLISKPILQAPKYNGANFMVTSDGCAEGFTAVLSQRNCTKSPSRKWTECLHPIAFTLKWTSSTEQNYKPFLLEFAALKFALDKFLDIIWGFSVKIEMDCQALKDVLISNYLNAAHARWRDGILAHNIVDIRHMPGKLNVIADGLSRQWEGQPQDIGLLNGSKWTVSEDWEANTGLINYLLQISTKIEDSTASKVLEKFSNEPVFCKVVKAILQIDRGTEVRD
jgi:hypothetical protein